MDFFYLSKIYYSGSLHFIKLFVSNYIDIEIKDYFIFQIKDGIYYLIAFNTKLAVTSPTARALQTTIITINPQCLKYDSRGFLSSVLNSCLK